MTSLTDRAGDNRGSPIGLVCFGGNLPVDVAQSATARGEAIFVVGFRGFASPALERFPHAWIKLGRVGGFFRLLRSHSIRKIVIVGAFTRPPLRELSLDWTGFRYLIRALRAMRGGGDDSAMRDTIRLFEENGLTVVGVSEVAPDLLASPGQLGRVATRQSDFADAHIGISVLDALSPFDVGQACVVLDGRPVAIEGAEGTDAMIARVAEMRTRGRLRGAGGRGVLVKAAKRGQDLRVDLPTIGPQTIERAAEAKLAGVVVEAGRTLIADRAATIALADRLGLFIVGLARE